MTKALYYLAMLLMVTIGSTLKFSHSHEPMPIGCDEFGYLNLAKSFDEGQSTDRPYLEGLLDTLRSAGITEPEFAWLITPHAYHIVPGTNSIINQYPPGTSFALSFIPLNWRNILFPSLVMLTLIILPLLFSKTYLGDWNYLDALFPVFVFIVTVASPFTTELARVNSLAVTFGLLIAAGMSVKNKPLLACFLIALTVNFRIVNILMILPVILFLPFASNSSAKGRTTNFMLLFKFGCLVIIAALPLLIYNYQLLGNPIASTYSVIDTAVNAGAGVFQNLSYYLSFSHHWLRVHLGAIAILVILCLASKFQWSDFIKTMAFPVLNYLFFGWHTVTMDYYPYASAMIMTGIVFGSIYKLKFPGKLQKIIPVAGIIISIVILAAGYNKYKKKEHFTYIQAQDKYAALCNYDIVWADLFSGTTEYVCGNNGFRFTTGTPRARAIVLNYLQQKGYSQVFVLNDLQVSPAAIESELSGLKLNYSRVENPELGPMLVLPADKPFNSTLR